MAAGSTYTPIATTTLGSAAASYTFSSISGSYTDLILVASVQTPSNDNTDICIQFNSDTGNNYSRTYLLGDGTSAISGNTANSGRVAAASISGNSVNSGVFTPVIFNIQNYGNSTTYKTVLARTANAKGYEGATVGIWRSTAAITSLTIFPAAGTINTGSTFTVYGIAAA
jgi:hypothetical protein